MTSIVDHIAILVDDLAVAEEWYTDKLSGKVTFRDPKYIRMRVSNVNIPLIDKKHYPYVNRSIIAMEQSEFM